MKSRDTFKNSGLPVTVFAKLLRTTEKGILLERLYPTKRSWFPRAEIEQDADDPQKWLIPEWLLVKNEWL